MWHGGVRVIVRDEEARILLVCQHHEGRDIWMLPGGAIEDGENAAEAAAREVLEETGLTVTVGDLVWHVEEVSKKRGQRFVNYFTASIREGSCSLGSDPEFSGEEQVLREVRFMGRSEIERLAVLYPSFLKDELWDVLKEYDRAEPLSPRVFKLRD